MYKIVNQQVFSNTKNQELWIIDYKYSSVVSMYVYLAVQQSRL